MVVFPGAWTCRTHLDPQDASVSWAGGRPVGLVLTPSLSPVSSFLYLGHFSTTQSPLASANTCFQPTGLPLPQSSEAQQAAMEAARGSKEATRLESGGEWV